MTRHGFLLFLGFLALYLIGAGHYDLFTDDELRYAEAGRQMLASGDWLVSTYNGRPRFQKPVLFYWVQAAAQAGGGGTPWAVRFPSALAGACVVWLTWHLGCRVGNARIGLWAALICGLSAQMLLVSRMALTDVFLLLFLHGTFTCFLYARLTLEPRLQGSWYRGMYLCMALGLLTKGPIALVLPALVLLPWLWRRGELRQTWRHCRPWSGAAILLVVAGPWYAAAAYVTGGEYLRHFLWHENWGRFTEVVNKHYQPTWFYLFLLVPLVFPWVGLLGPGLRRGLAVPAPGPLRRALPSLWLWQTCVVLGLFTLSRTKVWTYILPLGPALALLLATWLDAVLRDAQGRSRFLKGVFALFSLLTLVTAGIVHFVPTTRLPAPLTDAVLWDRLRGCCWLLAAAALVVQAVHRWRGLHAAFCTLAVSVAGWYLTCILTVLPRLDARWRAPVREAAAWVRAYPGATLFTVQIHELGLNFPTGLERVQHRRRGSKEELRLHLAQPYPVFVMVGADHADYMTELPFYVWRRWPGVIFGANLPPPPELSP